MYFVLIIFALKKKTIHNYVLNLEQNLGRVVKWDKELKFGTVVHINIALIDVRFAKYLLATGLIESGTKLKVNQRLSIIQTIN